MIVLTPAATTGSICSMRSTSTSMCVVWPSLSPGVADGVADRDARALQHREVVVFGEHGIRERVAVVVGAAVAHGLAFQHPEPWRGLAGVDDARGCPGHRLDVPGRHGGDAGHALAEVEGDALRAQHGAGVAVDPGEHVADGEGGAILGEQLDLGRGIHELEDTRKDVDAAHHARPRGRRDSTARVPSRAGRSRW